MVACTISQSHHRAVQSLTANKTIPLAKLPSTSAAAKQVDATQLIGKRQRADEDKDLVPAKKAKSSIDIPGHREIVRPVRSLALSNATKTGKGQKRRLPRMSARAELTNSKNGCYGNALLQALACISEVKEALRPLAHGTIHDANDYFIKNQGIVDGVRGTRIACERRDKIRGMLKAKKHDISLSAYTSAVLNQMEAVEEAGEEDRTVRTFMFHQACGALFTDSFSEPQKPYDGEWQMDCQGLVEHVVSRLNEESTKNGARIPLMKEHTGVDLEKKVTQSCFPFKVKFMLTIVDALHGLRL